MRLLYIGIVAHLLNALTPSSGAIGDPAFTAFRDRQHTMLAALDRQYGDFGSKVAGYAAIGLTASKGCQPASYMDHVIRDTTEPSTELFARPPLIRYLLQFGACLTPAQKSHIIDAEMDPTQLFGHGTLNHAMMSSTSYYLLADRYSGLKWHDTHNDVLTSATITARYKTLLLARFGKFLHDGYYEQLSPTYAVTNIYPLLNLVDFASDVEVRQAAEKQLIAALAIMGVDSFHGDVMPPLTRENPPFQLSDDPPTNARDVLWLYFGNGALDHSKRVEPPYAAMLAASTWAPPSSLLKILSELHRPYEVTIHTPSFSIWDAATHTELDGGAFIDRDFAIGAGNIYPDPVGYNGGTVAFRIAIGGQRPVGAVECYQPYYDGDEGEDAWDADRSSPFQFSWRRRNEGVLIYDVPEADPYFSNSPSKFLSLRATTASHLHQVAECRLPRQADELRVTNHSVFARYRGVLVAMISLGREPLAIQKTPESKRLADFMVVKVNSAKSAIYYKVASTRNEGTLSDFMARVESNLPTYNKAADEVDFLGLPPIRAKFNLTAPASDNTVVTSPVFIWRNSTLSFAIPHH